MSDRDAPLEREDLEAAVSGATAIVTLLHDRVDGDLLDAAGPQRGAWPTWRSATTTSTSTPPPAARCWSRTRPGVLTEATADLTLALILMATRRLGEERVIRSRAPWSWHMFYMLGTGLQSKTLGIVGLGAIGAAVARAPRSGCGSPTRGAEPRTRSSRRSSTPPAARGAAEHG